MTQYCALDKFGKARHFKASSIRLHYIVYWQTLATVVLLDVLNVNRSLFLEQKTLHIIECAVLARQP